MRGKRLPDLNNVTFPLLAQGEYIKVNGIWHGQPPWIHASANLSAHKVTENLDGTITVEPSILVTAGGNRQWRWHGFLENGIWRAC